MGFWERAVGAARRRSSLQTAPTLRRGRGDRAVGSTVAHLRAIPGSSACRPTEATVARPATSRCARAPPAGDTEACWTGPAGDRNRGACHDGTTTCQRDGEFATWGPCTGEELMCGDAGMPPQDSGPPDTGHDAGPPPQSCLPGSSLTALIAGANVTAYVPVGSWGEPGTGVFVVPIEGTGSPTTIATPNVVNTCGGNSLTGEVVCTSNTTDVYLIQGSALMGTLTSSATTSESFSGGGCETCNVAIDPTQNRAYLSIGYANGAAFQPLDLATKMFGTPIAADPMGTSESLLVDTVRGLVLSPNEQSNFQIMKTATGKVYDFDVPAQGMGTPPVFDSPGEDCMTGIAVATDEIGGTLTLVDLSQATFMSTTWSAPYTIQVDLRVRRVQQWHGCGRRGVELARRRRHRRVRRDHVRRDRAAVDLRNRHSFARRLGGGRHPLDARRAGLVDGRRPAHAHRVYESDDLEAVRHLRGRREPRGHAHLPCRGRSPRRFSRSLGPAATP